MLTSVYNRQSGKYILLKESIGRWCEMGKLFELLVLLVAIIILVKTLKDNYKNSIKLPKGIKGKKLRKRTK
jgi:hypothetical protein